MKPNIALSILWLATSLASAASYGDFQRRLETQYQRYDRMGANYHRPTSVRVGEWTPGRIFTHATTLEWDVTPQAK